MVVRGGFHPNLGHKTMKNTPSPSQLLAVALEAAAKASVIAKAQRDQATVSVSFKGDRNLVTTADIAAEQEIITSIRNHFPNHRILAEESAQTHPPEEYGDGYVWVIDPIDGTTNYAHGHYHVGVSIACALNGEVLAGVVAAPFLNETFSATKGGGAFLNDRPIRCSDTENVEEALVTTGFPYNRSNIHNICKRIERVATLCRDVRRLGAASLDICWVACGRIDAYFEETLNPWDGAAGGLIAREAGAAIGHYHYDSEIQKVSARYPGDLFVDNIVVAPPKLLPKLLTTLHGESTK
jgi:myo-inositol-1(or 4)-monophosphatase